MSMADYLSSKTADYAPSPEDILSITPQRTMTETADKNQVIHDADDGSIAVVSLSNASWFTVTLEWAAITNEDANTIFDYYNDTLKANGRERTFYWEHPTDGNTYTVRFLGPLKRVYQAGFVTHKEISQIKLRIEGVKS